MHGVRLLIAVLGFLVLWTAYFYGLDRLAMEAQGLPVTWTLMPES